MFSVCFIKGEKEISTYHDVSLGHGERLLLDPLVLYILEKTKYIYIYTKYKNKFKFSTKQEKAIYASISMDS